MSESLLKGTGELWEVVDKPGISHRGVKDFRAVRGLCTHTLISLGEGSPGRTCPGKEMRASLSRSLSPLFTAMCFVFQALQTSTFLGVIWNKEFGQSKK